MVDYQDKNTALSSASPAAPNLDQPGISPSALFFNDETTHQDHIGEYKSEYIKVQFDKTSAEVLPHIENLAHSQEIKKVDLNELRYAEHIIGEGKYTEKIYYGCKIIDCKKVFTLRNQY